MGYGVINEVGDLGLGFDEVSEEEDKAIKERVQKEEESDRK